MRTCTLSAFAILAVGSSFASAATIVQYAFTGDVLTPTTADAAVTGSTIAAADNTFVMITTTGTPSGSGTVSGPATAPWLRVGTPGGGNSGWQTSSYANAVAGNDYFQFSVTPDPSYTLDLDSISFSYAFGGTSTTERGVAVRYSFDNFSTFTDLGQSTTNAGTNVFNTYSAALTNEDIVNNVTTSPVVFRVYGFTSASGRAIAFDNITVEGAVVPEPASVGLLGAAAVTVLGRRRRSAK